jgi:hypothetical protein
MPKAAQPKGHPDSARIQRYSQLYLSNQLSPGDEMFDLMRDRFKDSPGGKRIEGFRAENERYQDGLNHLTMAQIDLIMRNEDVSYTKDPFDAIAKVRALRASRDDREKQEVASMTAAEKKAYFDAKEAKKKEQIQKHDSRVTRIGEEAAARAAKKSESMTRFEKLRADNLEKRAKQQAIGRAYLEKEAARRSGVPTGVAARAALDEKMRKEREEGLEPADSPVAPGSTDTAAPGIDALDHETTKEGGKESQDGGPAEDLQTKRRAEVAAMKKPDLDALMTQHKLVSKVGMKNAEKVEAILAFEFPSTPTHGKDQL